MWKSLWNSLVVMAMMLNCIHADAQKVFSSQDVFGKIYTADDLRKSHGFVRCAATEYEAMLQKNDPERLTDEQFEAWIAPLVEKAMASKSQNGGIVTIPVVVHVIHNGENLGVAPNITDNQVISQITAMNNDFRRVAGTRGFNNDAVGADIMIQFALAKVDPNGNPTNGINRVNMCAASWTTTEVNSIVKPATIWNPDEYMNMWSVRFGGSSSQILGYAQFPSSSGLAGLNSNGGAANTDGVVANFSTFGSSDYNDGTFMLSTPYDKGRTMTHEVGHYLGLRHIWGDATCGTDYCADTPTAHTANYNCNTSIASCDNNGTFEMVRNYMDYTNDTCMNIFTLNQKARIEAVMNNSPRRASLKTSTKDLAIPLFPNDAEIKMENTCTTPNSSCATTASFIRISLYNRGTSALTAAAISYTVGTVTETYNWTGNLAADKYAIVNLPVSAAMPAGPMNVSVASVNGGADQRASNNSFTTVYTPAGPAQANPGNFTFTLQTDYWGSETTWRLQNSAGTTMYSGGPYGDVPNPTTTTPLPAPMVQTWNLNTPGCYTFTINDTYGDGIYDYGGYYNLKNATGVVVFEGSSFTTSQSRAININVLSTGETQMEHFEIYPNPVSDILNVTKVSDKAEYTIVNVAGQIVASGKVKRNRIDVSHLVVGNYVLSITDNQFSGNVKFIKK